ncbi:MAG: hypothetical protein OEO17_08730, partial [Gemmatimonadota bacterium]|nr:hypothetical protein [Gemmatimonadota bacterium]
AVTPVSSRACPPDPPVGHLTQVWAKNVTLAGSWTLVDTQPSYITNGGFGALGASPSQVVRVAVRHKTSCNGVIDYSRWVKPYEDCVLS